MFFLGVDIGKRNHEAVITDENGHPLGKSLRFANSKKGSEQLLALINRYDLLPEDILVGMEATGHYWLSIYSYLTGLGFKVTVFNPMQSDTLRQFYLRKTKTDAIDALLIAQVIRMDLPEETTLPTEDLLRIKQLERFRYTIVDQTSDIKRKIITCLDQVFPEYEQLFADMFGKSSTKVLSESPLPEDLLAYSADDLASLLNEASEGRLGNQRSKAKASQLKDFAGDSFGISLATDVFKLEIQHLLQQLGLLENQLQEMEEKLETLVTQQDNYLTTIIGVGPVTAAVLLGEIGDIHRFERPNQVLAYAGLDASVHQSGDFTGTKNKISKRGSPYLRRALWQAAFVASNKDPVLAKYYQDLRSRGKPHGVAIGAVCRKLVNIIFAVWTNHQPYEIRS